VCAYCLMTELQEEEAEEGEIKFHDLLEEIWKLAHSHQQQQQQDDDDMPQKLQTILDLIQIYREEQQHHHHSWDVSHQREEQRRRSYRNNNNGLASCSERRGPILDNNLGMAIGLLVDQLVLSEESSINTTTSVQEKDDDSNKKDPISESSIPDNLDTAISLLTTKLNEMDFFTTNEDDDDSLPFLRNCCSHSFDTTMMVEDNNDEWDNFTTDLLLDSNSNNHPIMLTEYEILTNVLRDI